ncbi:putative exported protein [Arcticibacter svalbardensis MN12-7]|uniref:Putative exported protein n=1 Tax=Arcticibacter svalbardensis MN12-7 TaxID=1150600 RepID=R9GZF2_9SPHI|nr:alginate lyase family protein [Arcticibacter svalbardensis]EOR94369.1 putative exported protein [Arcticibacter svalbardensis MN12-7]
MNINFKKLLLLFSVVLVSLSGIRVLAQNKSDFLLTDERLLEKTKLLNLQGNTEAIKEVKSIIKQADVVLTAGPFSVTFNKTKMAPTNDKHDYVSQAPYWWPDPDKPDGKPYIRKDGKRNPEIYLLHDRSQIGDLSMVLKKLGLAYYYTANEKYASRAKLLLETWFINTNTKMNPNLNFGQYVPGLNEGRGIGIIETRGLIVIPDALALFSGSKSINDKVIEGVKDWYKAYTNWLLNSENGKNEYTQKNNHGTNYDLQVADFALFTGNIALAKKVINEFTIPRIEQQFTSEGAQPLELVRTNSWDYVNMNLDAWCKLAILSDHLSIDLWHTQTKDGKGIRSAVKWLIPFAAEQKKWETQQIGPFGYGDMHFIMNKASVKYPDLSFEFYFKKYPKGIEIE